MGQQKRFKAGAQNLVEKIAGRFAVGEDPTEGMRASSGTHGVARMGDTHRYMPL